MKKLKENAILTGCILVFIGGAFGGIFRLLLTQIPYIGSSPWVIVAINIVGSFLLAYLGSRISEDDEYSLSIKTFVGTGIIGGFTTFSTFILQINELLNKNYIITFIYVVLSLLLGYIAVLCGKYLGKRMRNQ